MIPVFISGCYVASRKKSDWGNLDPRINVENGIK
jgi:hypothetical protein